MSTWRAGAVATLNSLAACLDPFSVRLERYLGKVPVFAYLSTGARVLAEYAKALSLAENGRPASSTSSDPLGNH